MIWLQASPARHLPELQKAPILILTGEASFHAGYEHCNVKYLEQAGVRPTWIPLGKVGILAMVLAAGAAFALGLDAQRRDKGLSSPVVAMAAAIAELLLLLAATI